jgi:hypothetical protein
MIPTNYFLPYLWRILFLLILLKINFLLMSKFDEAMEKYRSVLSELKVSYDDALLTKVAKGLGPSIYNADSSLVSGSDQTELDRVKTNFLIKKLGLADSPDLDKAVKDVATEMKAIRMKPRAVFYYLLVIKFGKQAIYA